MKPNREAADEIIAILKGAHEVNQKQGPASAYQIITERLQDLANQLIPHGENYGHAARLHALTEKPNGGLPMDWRRCPRCLGWLHLDQCTCKTEDPPDA